LKKDWVGRNGKEMGKKWERNGKEMGAAFFFQKTFTFLI